MYLPGIDEYDIKLLLARILEMNRFTIIEVNSYSVVRYNIKDC